MIVGHRRSNRGLSRVHCELYLWVYKLIDYNLWALLVVCVALNLLNVNCLWICLLSQMDCMVLIWFVMTPRKKWCFRNECEKMRLRCWNKKSTRLDSRVNQHFRLRERVGRVGVRRTMLRIAPVLDAGETIVRQNGIRNTEDTETDIRYQI